MTRKETKQCPVRIGSIVISKYDATQKKQTVLEIEPIFKDQYMIRVDGTPGQFNLNAFDIIHY